jgi:DNA-binding IclR family transcriptional regulator
VEIGLHVLQALTALGEPANLGLIAEAAGMSASQTHRYLQSLIVADMAQQDAATGRYELGPAALRLGLSALARIDAFRIANMEIGEFTRRTGRTVQMAALGPLGPTVVRWHVGRPPVMTSLSVGSVLPLLSSATGHIFLAFAPDETEELAKRELEITNFRADDVETLRQKVRREGCARVSGAQIPGLNAAAFPIFDLQGRVVLTATALLPDTYRVPAGDRTEAELAERCLSISRRLGWMGD